MNDREIAASNSAIREENRWSLSVSPLIFWIVNLQPLNVSVFYYSQGTEGHFILWINFTMFQKFPNDRIRSAHHRHMIRFRLLYRSMVPLPVLRNSWTKFGADTRYEPSTEASIIKASHKYSLFHFIKLVVMIFCAYSMTNGYLYIVRT